MGQLHFSQLQLNYNYSLHSQLSLQLQLQSTISRAITITINFQNFQLQLQLLLTNFKLSVNCTNHCLPMLLYHLSVVTCILITVCTVNSVNLTVILAIVYKLQNATISTTWQCF